jgi:polysaccharide chain length determinant protein (PEP-CTERM system associated)
MNFDFSFYWRLLLRRLPVMMLFVLVCSGLGVITALKLPETWSTSARLLLEDPQIPQNMVNTTMQEADTEQLDIIQQKLLTRANLIDIANKYQVFPDMARLNPDTVYDRMRNATSVRTGAGRNRATVMVVEFEARSGRIAANVVNELVTLVLAENSSSRRERVESTLGFFEDEVDRLAQDLERQSTHMAQFKSDNADALPDDQRYRLDRLNRLQERLAQIDREQRSIEARREEVTQIYESTGRVQADNSRQRSPEEQRLFAARNELDNALAVYSESHPQVLRLKRVIAGLEEQLSSQPAGETDGDDSEDGSAASTQDLMFRSMIADLDARTGLLTAEAEEAQAEIDALQEANSQSARNAITLAALERDFENTQSRYVSALNNLNAAQVSERIENTAQGQRITVVENASVPQDPTGPNRPLVASAGGALGLGLAATYFLLLELLNRSIRRPEEMVQKFNVTPITVVPYMESRFHRMARRGLRVAAVLIIAIAVPLGLWYVDTNYLPLDLVVQRGLERLGLG